MYNDRNFLKLILRYLDLLSQAKKHQYKILKRSKIYLPPLELNFSFIFYCDTHI